MEGIFLKWLYVVMFASLWLLGILMLSQHFRKNFWIGLSLLCGGMASFTFSIHLTIVPYLSSRDLLNPLLSNLLYTSSVAAITVYFYLFAYVFCISGVWFGVIRKRKNAILITIALFIPAACLLGNHLLSGPPNIFIINSFRWWDGFYFILGCCLYFASYLLEKEAEARRSKRRIAFLFSAAILWAFSTDFLGFKTLRLEEWQFQLESNNAWKNNVFVVLGLVVTIVYFTLKYGFLGIKLRIERERLNSSMRALTLGVSILNHSIKNEIQKISYLAEKTGDYIHAGQSAKSQQTLEQVQTVANHLLNMVSRIKDKADDIELEERELDINELISSVTSPLKPQLEGRGIVLQELIESKGRLRCDPTHLKETLSNLLQNAIDVMPERNGSLSIHVYTGNKQLLINVADNGCGIPKEQHGKIFEPFYTTKKNTLSFGLGLSYCASVMQKHNGSIRILESEPGKGTVIGLSFPLNRFTTASKANRYFDWNPFSTARRINRF